MAAYATVEEFEAYAEPWTTTNEAALELLLERASRDVDDYLGPRQIWGTGDYAGLKLDPTKLNEGYRKALSDATCAMAEHRELVGEEAWAGHGLGAVAGRVKGPDFEYEVPAGPGGGQPRITAKVASELRRLGPLRVTGARARA